MWNQLKALCTGLVPAISLLASVAYPATNSITPGQTFSGATGWSDLDSYKYSSPGNERVTIRLARTGGGGSFNPVFDLISPNGDIVSGAADFVRGLPLAGAGIYQIICRDFDAYDSGTYEVTLLHHPGANLTDAGETNRIVAGQTVSGPTGWSDMDIYEYSSPGNEWVTLLLSRTGGGGAFNPVFDLVTAGGDLLLTDQGYLQGYRLTNAGTYQILCRDFDAYDAGSYEVTLIHNPGTNLADAGETNAILPGQTISGTTGWSDLDVYEYSSPGNERVTLRLARTGGGGAFNPVFELISPNGDIVSGVADFVRGLSLAGAGTYQIICRDLDAYDSGTYEVTLLHHPGANLTDAGETNRIVAGQTVSGPTGWSDMDIYEYSSPGNEWVTLLLSRTGGGGAFNPVFDLVTAGGDLLLTDQGYLQGYRLTNAGTYQILCRDFDAYDAGSYEVTLIRNPGTNLADAGETNAILPGQTISGTTGWSDLDVYEYSSPGNERVTLRLARTGGGGAFNPVFELISPNGDIISGAADFVRGLPLAGAGIYQIICRDFDAYDSGTYEVTLLHHPGANLTDAGETNRIVAGQTVSGPTGWSDMDIYEYSSPGNEWVTLLLSRTGGGGAFNPVFDLVTAGGDLLLTDQGYLQGYRLTNAGTYQILCRDFDAYDAGSYEVTLIRNPGTNLADAGETNAILPGQTISGTTGWSDLDAYEFEAVAGDAIWVTLSRNGGGGSFNPIFDLHAPDGNIVASGTRLWRECLTLTGRYQLVCRDYDAYDAGAYSLSFLQTPGPPPTGSPPAYLQVFSCDPGTTVVRWPTAATGFHLQSTTALRTPAAATLWSDISPPYPSMQGFHYVTNTASFEMQFFRLIQP